MPAEPSVKRTVAFIDGQNLFCAAKKAFGYRFPNYDPKALADRVAGGRGWILSQSLSYTGIPDPTDSPFVACAFPSSPTTENRRGINGTEWIQIDRATYDACLDPNDYRPKP